MFPAPYFRSPWHRLQGLPSSPQWTPRNHLGGGYQDDLSPHIAAPEWVQGISGSSAPSFGRLDFHKPTRSTKPKSVMLSTTRWPIGQSLEPGATFPVGRNPLRLDSPCGLSAKPGILVVCLAPHPYLSGACCSQGPSVQSCLAPTAHRLPVQAMGISSHSIIELLGAPAFCSNARAGATPGQLYGGL